MKKFLFILILLAIPAILLAQGYKLAAPIPGGEIQATTISQYMPLIIPFMLSFAAISALVMFSIGAFMYMISAIPASIQNGKSYMIQAILGLLLALGSVILLRTINPNLTRFDLDLDKAGKFNGSRSISGLGGACGGPNYGSCGAQQDCKHVGPQDYRCIPRADASTRIGLEGSACRSDGTCEGNLVCESNVCKNADPSVRPGQVLRCVMRSCNAVEDTQETRTWRECSQPTGGSPSRECTR